MSFQLMDFILNAEPQGRKDAERDSDSLRLAKRINKLFIAGTMDFRTCIQINAASRRQQ
jgi:hypothetical protein